MMKTPMNGSDPEDPHRAHHGPAASAANPASSNPNAIPCFPIRLLTFALALTCIFGGMVVLVALQTRGTDRIRREHLRLEELRGRIMHLDEVLTMSARMAAATGDPAWEARYRRFEPQLDAAIKNAIALHATGGDDGASETDAANQALVAMEDRAFDLVRAGRAGEAGPILAGSEYETQKKIYARGIQGKIVRSRDHLNKQLDLQLSAARWLSIGAAALVALTAWVWVRVLRSLRRWRGTLLEAIAERCRAENELRSAHRQLEIRVEERTAELREQRKRLDDILATVPGAVWEAWGEPHAATQRINFVSNYIENMAGYSAGEILATPNFWPTLVHPDDRERSAREAAAIYAGGKGGTAQFRWLHKDGHCSWVEAHMVVICDAAGAPAGMRGVTLDVTSRKHAEAELESAHKKLRQASHESGMAEVATSVLHNVGNVLNSVNTSISVATEKVAHLKAAGLGRIAALLSEHAGNLPAFFAEHSQGARLPDFLAQLAGHFAAEQKAVLGELASLRANLDHINEIVAMQQSYAVAGGVVETLPLAEVIEDALRMNAAAFDRHGAHVVRDFDPSLPPIAMDRNKLLLILVNLVRNAKYACDDGGGADKRITVSTHLGGNGCAEISVSDNGIGIPPENLPRIFEHGFTTRKKGHGFGLHSSALAASEMDGSLHAHSDGHGHGATFTIELPLTPARS